MPRGSRAPPRRSTIDSASTGPGDLFFGLRGANVDGGEFAAAAIAAGAWGVVVEPQRAAGLEGAWVFAAPDPLAAMQALAGAWRRALGARVIGVTGSVGKTSVKDIARALLPGRVHANRENLNTEIGLPLSVLEAPADAELLVLEMAMRGPGQIAELAAIAEPEIAVITNVGPVHVELLGSLEAIAAAKAEVLDALPRHGVAVVPADAGELEPHLGRAPLLLRFGTGGDVEVAERRVVEGVTEALIATPSGSARFHFPFTEAHNLTNALAAIAAGVALGAAPAEMADRAANIGFSRFRGERLELGDGIVLVNDCYNANPVSMRAALDHLATLGAERTIAVLGEMGELGRGCGPPTTARWASTRGRLGSTSLIGVGEPARDYGPDELVGAPEDAAELLAAQLGDGDAVLVKGSRSAAPGGRRRSALEGADLMGVVLIAGMASMLICIFLGPKFIEYLRVKEFGQHIREDGPQEHHAKAGTPTMGGLIVFASVCVPYLVLSDRDAQSLAVLGVAIGCAAIGFADDFIKIVKRRSLGLSARWKLLFQLILAFGLWWVARHEVGLEPILYFRIGDGSIDLGPVLYFVLVFLVIAGTSNGVNLTDGLDGLAAGSCAIVLLAYTAIAFVTGERQNLALLSACLVGACIGFLWFNAFPASIFMGDTGSLGLGGAIGALAVMTQTEVLLIIIGGIFVIEALSVAVQVFSFKAFRRRVLLMAPLHHHFEMMAWSETKIMLRFWIIAAVCSGIGFTLYQQSIGR